MTARKRAKVKRRGVTEGHASEAMCRVLQHISDTFPAAMSGAFDPGGWVYLPDYEKCAKHLKAAMILAGLKP